VVSRLVVTSLVSYFSDGRMVELRHNAVIVGMIGLKLKKIHVSFPKTIRLGNIPLVIACIYNDAGGLFLNSALPPHAFALGLPSRIRIENGSLVWDRFLMSLSTTSTFRWPVPSSLQAFQSDSTFQIFGNVFSIIVRIV